MNAKGHIAGLLTAIAMLVTGVVASEQASAQTAPSYKAGSAASLFGKMRKPVFYDDALATQFEDAMSGGVDVAKRLPNGATMVTTCRPHNCPDKAAAIMAPNGQLIAAGMVGSQCRKRPNTSQRCDNEPTAYVFIRAGAQYDYARKELSDWGRNVLAGSINIDGTRTQNRKVYVVQIN